jgi:hypothetical protein
MWQHQVLVYQAVLQCCSTRSTSCEEGFMLEDASKPFRSPKTDTSTMILWNAWEIWKWGLSLKCWKDDGGYHSFNKYSCGWKFNVLLLLNLSDMSEWEGSWNMGRYIAKILRHSKVAARHFHIATCPSIPHGASWDFFLLTTKRTDFEVISSESEKMY